MARNESMFDTLFTNDTSMSVDRVLISLKHDTAYNIRLHVENNHEKYGWLVST